MHHDQINVLIIETHDETIDRLLESLETENSVYNRQHRYLIKEILTDSCRYVLNIGVDVSVDEAHFTVKCAEFHNSLIYHISTTKSWRLFEVDNFIYSVVSEYEDILYTARPPGCGEQILRGFWQFWAHLRGLARPTEHLE